MSPDEEPNTIILQYIDENGKSTRLGMGSKEPLNAQTVDACLMMLGEWLKEKIATATTN